MECVDGLLVRLSSDEPVRVGSTAIHQPHDVGKARHTDVLINSNRILIAREDAVPGVDHELAHVPVSCRARVGGDLGR
eukprot:7383668-Prymnesium_polylepis.1